MKQVSFLYYYKYASKYYEEHGNLLVPQNYIIKEQTELGEENICLGSWIARMRTFYKKGKLSLTMIEYLNNIGMVWNVYKENFDENYNLAKKYYEQYNNLLISETYTVNGVHLGAWIASLRLIYHGKKRGNLTEEQIALLNKIGMIWKLRDRNSEKWMLMLEKSFLTFLDNYPKQEIENMNDVKEINKKFIK